MLDRAKIVEIEAAHGEEFPYFGEDQQGIVYFARKIEAEVIQRIAGVLNSGEDPAAIVRSLKELLATEGDMTGDY